MTGAPYNSLVLACSRLEVLLAQHGPAHEEVVQLRMDVAEMTGQQGDVRGARLLYHQLGDDLKKLFGPFDRRVLDAYEGVARWVAND